MSSKGFDLLAPWYDLLLTIPPGKHIKGSQYFFIDQLPFCEKVLIIGEGTGSFLKEILLKKKTKRIWVVENSKAMVRAAEKKIKRLPESEKAKVRFITTPFQEFHTEEKFDLIVTNFFLDLFAEPTVRSMGVKIREMLRPQGSWYFTDFVPLVSSDEYGWFKKTYIQILYCFFSVVTGIEGKQLPDFEKIFMELKMEETASKFFAKKLIKTILMKPKPI